MLESINDVAEQLDRTPTRREYDRHRSDESPPSSTIKRNIGSWDSAVAMAGLNPDEVPVKLNSTKQKSKEDIINAVRYVADQIDGVPTVSEYKRYRRTEDPSYGTIYNHYSDADSKWDAVLSDAGFDSSEADAKKYTRDECLKAIQRVADKLDDKPTQSDYKRISDDSDPSLTTIKNRFNGWTYAMREAGISD